jgi:hypothetical protein
MKSTDIFKLVLMILFQNKRILFLIHEGPYWSVKNSKWNESRGRDRHAVFFFLDTFVSIIFTLEMKKASSSETSLNIYLTARYYIPDNIRFYIL